VTDWGQENVEQKEREASAECEPAGLDAFEENFDDALTALANDTIARIERDTDGMTDAECATYFLASARAHLARVEELNAPDCIIERARSVVARREAVLEKSQRESASEPSAATEEDRTCK